MKTNGEDLLNKYNKLVSENAELMAGVAELRYIAAIKDKEYQMLKFNSIANSEAVSAFDSRGAELEILQDCINNLQQQRAGAINREEVYLNSLNISVRERHQLQDLQQQYVCLQTQFADLKSQLEAVTAHNVLLQQQNVQL